MKWSHELLWNKAKLYCLRAAEEDRTGQLYPFWAILGLELLARATLARVHPALLADPQSEGANLLYAFGFGQPKRPRSIPAKTVFLRCTAVVPGFLEEDFKAAMALVELRNEELHTGEPAFADIPTSAWLPQYYRICRLLLEAQDRTLTDLFGDDEANAARHVIDTTQEETIKRARVKITSAQRAFNERDQAERERLLAEARILADSGRRTRSRIIACPSCSAPGLLRHERVHEGEPQLVGEEIQQDESVLPVEFTCFACGLSLDSNGELVVAGLGDAFVIQRSYDPIEYLGIDISEYLAQDEDYGND